MINFLFGLTFLLGLVDYKLAKIFSQLFSGFIKGIPYQIILSVVWVILVILPFLWFKTNVFKFEIDKIKKNIKTLIFYFGLNLLGIIIFKIFGITKLFTAKYPLVFFTVIPLVEEIVFRGWMFDMSKKATKYSQVLITAMFFGLHHLQYFNFKLIPFALFQVIYTFVLGILYGKMREKSGSIYLSLVSHIILNYLTLFL